MPARRSTSNSMTVGSASSPAANRGRGTVGLRSILAKAACFDALGGSRIVADQQRYPNHRSAGSRAEASRPLWHYYVGITALLLVMVVALTGGIIWYNTKKSNQLAIEAARRMMQEAGDDVTNRIKLLYDPMYAIVGIASLVPELTSPGIKNDLRAMSLILRVLRTYPQIMSLYVGFDSGEFFMVTHIAGENGAALREGLRVPKDAVFANEI